MENCTIAIERNLEFIYVVIISPDENRAGNIEFYKLMGPAQIFLCSTDEKVISTIINYIHQYELDVFIDGPIDKLDTIQQAIELFNSIGVYKKIEVRKRKIYEPIYEY